MTALARPDPIGATRLALRAQRVDLARLTNTVAALKYLSPHRRAEALEAAEHATAALLGLDRALRAAQQARERRRAA